MNLKNDYILILFLILFSPATVLSNNILDIDNNQKVSLAEAIFMMTYIAENVFVSYPNNEDGEFQDMLTPAYYLENNDPFRDEVNRFVYYARQEQFHHPLKNESSQIPDYSVSDIGVFGAAKGPNQDLQYHPAVDMHVGNRETSVNLYAAFDGYVSTAKDADKYRHYVSIIKDVIDNDGEMIGKIMVLYGHVDLDLDESDNLIMDTKYVNKGDLISKHLYADTVGGPHLHYEIRYYRPNDVGNEVFYGGKTGPAGNPEFTELSAGPWSYGYWHPDIGYGFADPENHGVSNE